MKTFYRLTLLCAVAALMLSACANPARITAPEQVARELIPDQVTPHRGEPGDVPQDVRSALLPQPELLSADSFEPEESRFNISTQQTPAREFFMGLVEGTRFNMIVHPDVGGTISLSLKKTTVPEVMQIVHNVYGYPYRFTAGTFQVMPPGLQTRIFHINYLNLKRHGLSQTRVSSGQVSDAGENGNSKETVNGSQIDTESETDFWSEVKAALQTIIGDSDGRKVVVQPLASIAVIHASPEELMQVEEFLNAVHSNLQRQVIIDAKILEVELRDGFQSGINWAAMGDLGSGQSVLVGQTGGGTLINSGSSSISGNSANLDPNLGSNIIGTAASAFGGMFSTALRLKDFTAFIELLQTQGDVQVLSSPRIATLNNQKAVIKVGTDEFFVTDVSSESDSDTDDTTNDITLTPFFSGIALDVTAQIDPHDKVTLHIHPTISEVRDQTKIISMGNHVQTLPLAFSSVRETDSIVSADSGQVVVIGGLMKNRVIKEKASIPLLGDIPLLGSLFTHTKTVTVKSELVILLRPHVVNNRTDWQNANNRTREQMQQITNGFDPDWQSGLLNY